VVLLEGDEFLCTCSTSSRTRALASSNAAMLLGSALAAAAAVVALLATTLPNTELSLACVGEGSWVGWGVRSWHQSCRGDSVLK
jgi:hypothetical protein